MTHFLLTLVLFSSMVFAGKESKMSYQTITHNEATSREINGVNVLYWTMMTMPGPKPGMKVGTRAYAAHMFFISKTPFKRTDIKSKESFDARKYVQVVYSFWAKDGDFKLDEKNYTLQILEDAKSNDVDAAMEGKQTPIQIQIIPRPDKAH